MAVIGEKLSKTFAGMRALDNVDIEILDGEIHALLGANGSGKSTLVKILTGVYQPDGGAIAVAGSRLAAIASPRVAKQLGIAVVHQETPLIYTSTVAECIALFRGYPTRLGTVAWRKLEDEVLELFERFGIHVDPRQVAGRLSPAERATVALVIALDQVKAGVQLLVLDEVTASLPTNEAEPYLERVTALAKTGIAVLMVTHRLAELYGRAARMTILQDGRRAFSGAAGTIDDDAIVAYMAGRDDRRAAPKPRGPSNQSSPASGSSLVPTHGSGEARLRVENLSAHGLRNLSFDLHAGEILGVAGLADTGIGALPHILSGALSYRHGQISLQGRVLRRNGGPGQMIQAGVMVLPADRQHSGGIGTLSVAENMILPELDNYWFARGHERTVVARLIADFDVRPPRPFNLFGKLSGGNQQKALLGKWLHLKPMVLVLDDPTSGVDPGARDKIFEILRHATAEGLATLFFSTEPEQLAAMCSRVLVIRDGTVATQLSGVDLNHHLISKWCYT